ncbi:MAG TPA: acetoacetate--CoA ligase [Anaerolineales bacterium]|nr:acetoacetate--CoA ligase [Anaerolineales bacterium]
MRRDRISREPLWRPDADRVRAANLTHFIDHVNGARHLSLRDYAELYQWSVTEIPAFWAAIWDFAQIRSSRTYNAVLDDIHHFPGARWFEGARLNYAENLLRFRDDRPALIFRAEGQRSATLSYSQLHGLVGRLAASLRSSGVQPGDRVVAYMPNLIETAVAMLASASVGAIWSSCATDMGPGAAVERLGQVEPTVLFTVDGYYYKGRAFNTLTPAEQVARGIPSLKRVVVVPYADPHPAIESIPNAVLWDEFLAPAAVEAVFEQLPFDHPLFIMFSSGTTGKPKCMVQGAGGVLINHLKELILHTDLRRDDRILYITSCSWMMWNWLLGALAVGATVVLYDGSPTYPDSGAMWRLIDEEDVTIFGCSASYLQFLRKEGFSPRSHFDLGSLREISQTGSPLSAEGFEYVYREIKQDLHFNSISGGTDINGCFSAGSPTIPVYAGELQAPALGMKIAAYDPKGSPVVDEEGELVCEAPAPSMPLHFWNDPEGSRYHSAYFDTYPGVWRHGDFVLFHSDTGGITFYGRSDAVLKPSGVRIGTAEIYSQLERLDAVADSLAVGQDWQDDQRVILFVKLSPGVTLTPELERRIRATLRENASPRHVPALIFEAPEIPYTQNMKKVESAVNNILNGRPVLNQDALANPGSLDYFRRVAKELGAHF